MIAEASSTPPDGDGINTIRIVDVSGHSIKHLLMAVAGYEMVLLLNM